MKNVTVEEVEIKNKRTGEVDDYFRVSVGDVVEQYVWVSDVEAVKSTEALVSHCLTNMCAEDVYCFTELLQRNGSLILNGDYRTILEVNLVLADGSQDVYNVLEDVRDVLEEEFKVKYGFDISLNIKDEPHYDRGFAFVLDWDLKNSLPADEYNKFIELGFTEIPEQDTELLIKLLDCSFRVKHDLRNVLE